MTSSQATTEWTKESIWELLQRSEKAVIRAVLALYRCQTDDEQSVGDAIHLNNQGFNKSDAPYGTSIAQQVLSGRYLSQKQIDSCRRMLRKYCGQLSGIANS